MLREGFCEAAEEALIAKMVLVWLKYEVRWCIIRGLSEIGFRRDAKFEFERNSSGINCQEAG